MIVFVVVDNNNNNDDDDYEDLTKGRRKVKCHMEKDMIGDVMINNENENRNTFYNGIIQ